MHHSISISRNRRARQFKGHTSGSACETALIYITCPPRSELLSLYCMLCVTVTAPYPAAYMFSRKI